MSSGSNLPNSTREAPMQSFGDQIPQVLPTDESLPENTWDDPSAWTPEVDSLKPRIPEGAPEADVLEQYLPA
jgi:hypothetical protein